MNDRSKTDRVEDVSPLAEQRPYRWSYPAERNQQPILERLRNLLPESADKPWRILEIGSGTGQHAVHFSAELRHIRWIASDLPENHPTLKSYFEVAGNERLTGPLNLDAESLANFKQPIDVIYTANTCHIMSWDQTKAMICNAGQLLQPQGRLIIYGPFHVGGQATSIGNYRFDQTLSQTNAWQGIRDREHIVWEADAAGFTMTSQFDMPANNQLLVFERRGT